MSLEYKDGQDKQENWWTSYSDLWAMLSIVFLLLYVTASLRSGTQGVLQKIEYRELQQRAQELEEQNRVYATLKNQALQESSEAEQKTYEQLMDKLSLLTEEAKEEKEQLRKKANDNEQKQIALNQYQQIIRNIIDTNVLAKSQIHTRDKVIVEKKQTITEKQQAIEVLNAEVERREQTIAKNEEQIQEINAKVASQIQNLRAQEKRAKMSKKSMEDMITRLKNDSQAKIAQIEEENQTVRDRMQEELVKTEQNYQNQLESIKAEHAAKMQTEKQAFEAGLKKQKLSAAARAKKLKEFQAQAASREKELQGQLAGLEAKVGQTQARLKQTEADLAGTAEAEAAARRSLASAEAEKDSLVKQKNQLGGELKQAREKLEAKKKLVGAMRENFAKAGIKANIDEASGDVTLDFGEEYFESGKAGLKSGMVKKLEKFIPIYSKSLFENKDTASKISNVEIIGFASSTYKGKYVNPASLKPENQQAINYNLKLSFDRANSIFRHIFDPSKMSYEHQKRLLPMVKVAGRGFLPEGADPKKLPEDMPEEKFCKEYGCKQAQRVVIKFNLKD